MKLKFFWFRFLISLLIVSVFFNLKSMPQVQAQENSSRKTIIWAQDSDIEADPADFASWCVENNFNTVNVVGTGISAANISYLHSQNISVFKNTYPIPSCLPDPVYYSTYNLTEQILYMNSTFTAYDGIILDDTQNVWHYAHNISMFDDDYLYYQQLIDNATDILVPTFGSENVTVLMQIYADSVNYTKVPLVTAPSLTFSYYYAPDPLIQYYGTKANITGEWWTGLFYNTSANAWDIPSYYSSFGPVDRYAYEGWIWLTSEDQHPRAETLIKTYNSIVDLSQTYTVNNLEIGFHWTLYNNTEITKIIRHIAKNWLDGPAHLDDSLLYIYDWSTYYWEEYFDTLPNNESESTWEGWQYIITNEANYSYHVQDNVFWLNYTGNFNHSGYGGFSLERMFTSERDLNISADVIPDFEEIHKSVIIRATGTPYLAYRFDFGGYTYDLNFVYRIAKAQLAYREVQMELTHWTANSTYHVNFLLSTFSASVSIRNSTWSWNYTIPSEVLYYNTLKVIHFSLSNTIGNITERNETSMRIGNITSQPLIAWNTTFETQDYIGYNHFFAQFYGTYCAQYFFVEDGLIQSFSGEISTLKVNVYAANATILDVDCLEPVGVTGNVINSTWTAGRLRVFISSSSLSVIVIEWKFETPVMFFLGMFGLVALMGSPLYGIYAAKKRDRDSLVTALIMGCIGFGLFIAWLWGV